MHKKPIFGLLILLLVALPLLAACDGETTPTPTAATSTPAPSTTTPAVSANWWDELGEPQYGGELNFRVASLNAVFDTYTFDPGSISMCFVNIFAPDRTVEPDTYSYNLSYIPMEYVTGHLVSGWETPDAGTLILHVNQDAHWQDKEPLNGRAFNAYDLEYYFHRLLGIGHGYTEPVRPALGGLVESVTVEDDYTITVKFAKPGYGTLSNFVGVGPTMRVDPEEVLEAEESGFLSDWTKVVSVGPWILTDFATGSYAEYDKNPDFWGYDERYPENQLPYADKLTLQCIPDISTAMAALRTGQIDFLEGIGLAQSQTLAESNPELLQAAMPAGSLGLSMRCDLEPFSDIRVRKALQMAINREEIATAYYEGTVAATPSGMTLPDFSFSYPYEEWPQSLKDEYAYNVEGAKALLAEAGYPDGLATSMWIESTADLQLAQIVKAYLAEIGVDATIEVTDTVTLNSMINARTYDGTTLDIGTRNFAPGMLIQSFYCPDHNLNQSVICDAAFDALHDEYSLAATEAEALAIVKEMDKMGIEQHWLVNMPCTYNYNVYQPYLKGYNGEAIQGNSLGGYYHARWWIDQALKDTLR